MQASTTELGKLFQIFTMRAEKNGSVCAEAAMRAFAAFIVGTFYYCMSNLLPCLFIADNYLFYAHDGSCCKNHKLCK